MADDEAEKEIKIQRKDREKPQGHGENEEYSAISAFMLPYTDLQNTLWALHFPGSL